MNLLAVAIEGFRGIQHANIRFGDHDVLIGPNGSGKSTIIDALSLVFGRTRLVRDLTEHDFHGSCPEANSRIRIIATLDGFEGNDPDRHDGWFREGRAVPKWWNSETGVAEPESSRRAQTLCAQIAFAARFDLEELVVESVRYFHDDDDLKDPFLDDVIQAVPTRLFDDIGYYVLPARRTWEGAASFASELFRKAVATVGGIPAGTVLDERDRLRQPQLPLEADTGLEPLVGRINEQLAELLPAAPRFHLRVTATDSESLLRALVPHYDQPDAGPTLPIGRHGMGLLSLQTFILLLELGRERRAQGKPFLFAMEEPELHIPPGIQRRLVAQAVSIAEQTICTSHSPRVAGYYPATSVQILDRRPGKLAATPLVPGPLPAEATNATRKLCNDDRPRVVEALMYHRVLIPEGRTDFEWFRLLADALESGDLTLDLPGCDLPPFGTVVGMVPTHDAAVAETFQTLRRLRSGLVPLVDGDSAGDEKLGALLALEEPPGCVVQWQDGWAMEDAIGWILEVGGENGLTELKVRITRDFDDIETLVAHFKQKTGAARLKGDYLAYEEVASVIRNHSSCRERAGALLNALTAACLGRYVDCPLLVRDDDKSSEPCTVLRLSP